jgi:CO/xanthine dehydrogenase Mo-binding subunit
MSGEVASSVRQFEGPAKVTGEIDYIGNLALAGMLHGKIVRSTRPHAVIDKIDTTAAQDSDGVRHVITGADILRVMPEPYSGPAFHDQPPLAIERVRYVGEPVALVLADSADAAARAAEQVVIDYSDLPFVFDEVAACSDSAPLVHERLRPGDAFADLRHLRHAAETNIALDATVRHGDAELAPAGSRLFTHEYKTQAVMHTPLESHVALADPSEPGRLQIFSTTQSPSFVRLEVARLLGWPEQRVRVRSSFLGGGFGAKLYVKLEPLVAAAAVLVRKPVRIALSMEEQFFTICRHATTTRITSAIDGDNRIISRQVDIWWNGGAYADIGPRVTQKSGFVAAGAYRIPNVRIDSRAVYTHRTPAGAMRGFGVPQVIFAVESHMDEIARELGIDPVRFRLDNLIQPGDVHASGTVLANVEVEQAFRAVLDAMPPDNPVQRVGARPEIRRGRGYAVALKAVVTPTTSVAEVVMAADGSVSVHQNTVDMGQGSATATAQIAAEVLAIPAESITMLRPDTDLNPYDMGTLGSRSLFHMGNAVKSAAQEVRDQLLAMATSVCPQAHDHVLADGHICGVAYREVFAAHFGAQAGTLVGRGTFTPAYDKPDPATGQSSAITAFWMAGAVAAEVSVDVDTGKVRVDRLVVSGDVGRAINPYNVRRQLSGGAVMQLGMTLSEEMLWEDGQLTNPGLGFYKVPGILDVPPDIEVAIIESPHPDGPFGAKGVGETGTFAVSPAVANAVADAIGARVRELPLTPERVLEAIRMGGRS